MAIDPRFFVMSLQEFFIDKDTGLPLSAGVLTFYNDNSRTDLKPIYTISGTPPNYTYVPLPNPLTLSSVGTPQDDSGNDVLIYYFPYDGTPDNTTLTPESYYVTCQSAGSNTIDQFTREGIPNAPSSSSGATESDSINFIPNGQFLIHNNIPANPPIPAGQITQAVTQIAPGGWTFERPNGSTSVDNISFSRYGNISDTPSGNPRYALQVTTSSPDNTDAFKNICIKFRDVNTFASGAQSYTFSFSGMTLNLSTLSVSLGSIKYFGANGSSTVNTNIPVTWTLTPSEQLFQISFIFGDNSAYTLGTDDSDYIQIALKLPTNALLSIGVTDFLLEFGNNQITSFPVQTQSDMLSRGVAGWMPVPNPDGSDLGLPLVSTLQGLQFDSSNIGKIFANAYSAIEPNELQCDGSQYKTSLYNSTTGIPYSRLQKKLFANIGAIGSAYIQVPRWGTGAQYFTAWNVAVAPANEVIIHNNSAGVVTATADGAVSTGFTFSNIHIATASNYSCTVYWAPGVAINVYIYNNDVGAVADITGNTSGFSVATWRPGNTQVSQISSVLTIDASTLAGKYFQFTSNVLYYVWFKVNGSGADPAPGGTGILVSLNSTDDADTVAHKIVDSLNGGQVSSVKVVAGSSVVPNSYFTINSSTEPYYVWMSLNGAGTDPLVANKTGIEVAYLSSDTNTQIANKIQAAINSQYFAVPQLQGAFLRGVDPNEVLDIEGLRLSTVDGVYANVVGTYQWDDNQYIDFDHTHSLADFVVGNNGTPTGDGLSGAGGDEELVSGTTSVATLRNGYRDSKPRNFSVNYVIKY